MMTSIKRPPELDKKMEEILELRKYNKYEDAISKAKHLTETYPNIGSVFGLLASIYFELDRFKEAAENYEKATKISPKSEMASLGLFHSLWQLERNDEAFKEMKRYMSVAESAEYNELLEKFANSSKD
jgi:tetratricopeptide (TPR) repeat protein